MRALLDWLRPELARHDPYADWFGAAFKRARRLGLAPPVVQVRDVRVLTNPRNLEALAGIVQDLVAPLGPELVAGNCAPVTAALVKPIAEALDCPAYFTIGWINIGVGEHSRDVFRMTERDFKRWLRGFLPREGHASFHCWVTLASMEIIDATITTTQAVANGVRLQEPGIITRHADEMSNLRYYPMIIGDSFLERAGWVVAI
jgi:hypothetical protein